MRLGIGLWLRGGGVTAGEPVGDTPSMIIPPVLSSVATHIGVTISVTDGVWEGADSFLYQWQGTDSGVVVDMEGATSNTYMITERDIGYRIRCRVTAVNANGETDGNSDMTYKISPVDFDWQDVGLTAGTDGAQWVGYSDGGFTRPSPAFGSITGQPSARTDLLALYDDTNSDVYLAVFMGDYSYLMRDLPLDIGGTVFTPFEVEVISGNTWLRYNGVGDLIDGSMYQVRFG